MKMVTALFALSLSATAVFAQKGVEDGSRYGHGQDSKLLYHWCLYEFGLPSL